MLSEEYTAYKLWEYERKEIDRKLELRRRAYGSLGRESRTVHLFTALFRSIFSSTYF